MCVVIINLTIINCNTSEVTRLLAARPQVEKALVILLEEALVVGDTVQIVSQVL